MDFLSVQILIEWVEVGLGHLHANQNFVIGVFLALNVLHLEEAVKDAAKGLHLVDLLKFALLAVFLHLLVNQ